MPRYATYKNPGVEWLEEIPATWNLKKIKFLGSVFNGDSLNENKKAQFESDDVAHIAYISSKDIDADLATINYKNGLRIPVGTGNYKIAPKGSSLLCIEGGSAGKKIAYTNQNVCFVNKLACFESKKLINSKYFYYSLKAGPFQEQFRLSMTGLIGGVSISSINNFALTLPTPNEQAAIATFLDQRTMIVDQAIAIKEKQITLLKERKQILIQNAVTRGLNPDAPMRDSGVEYIGEIPAHWMIKRLKYVLDERNERSITGEEPLFMVSQVHGLVVRSEYHDKAEVAKSNVDNKIVYINDLVFNKLKAHLGVFFKSNISFKGIVSPDYAVYKPKGFIHDLKLLEYLFRHPAYIGQFIIRTAGIVEGLIRLYTDELFDIYVPVPPTPEQQIILQYIETESSKINKAITIQQQIEKLKEYKTTLINSAVTGKIKVT